MKPDVYHIPIKYMFFPHEIHCNPLSKYLNAILKHIISIYNQYSIAHIITINGYNPLLSYSCGPKYPL